MLSMFESLKAPSIFLRPIFFPSEEWENQQILTYEKLEAAHVWPFILKITLKKIKYQFFCRLIFWLLDWSVNFLSIYCGYTSRLLNFNIPPSELMTLFSPALVSPLSGETSLYSPQFVEHRYKQHSLTQNICSQRPWLFPVIWNCFCPCSVWLV